MIELNWYVVRVVSGQEKKAKIHMEKEVSLNKLSDHVTQVLTPTEKVYQIRKLKDGKSKRIQVEKNFFPGYIFVEADIMHGEVMHLIKSVPGVIGFLMLDDRDPNSKPKPMRKSEVKKMLGRIHNNEMVAEAEANSSIDASYDVGESVKVIDGPFNGFTGVVQDVNEEKKKVNVMVKIFGRSSPLTLNYGQVEKV